MRRFRLSRLAKTDLAEIRGYIARDNPDAADRQIRRFFETFQTLARGREIGESRPDLGPSLRVFSVGNYVIVYRPTAGGAHIARVLSGYRDIQRLF